MQSRPRPGGGKFRQKASDRREGKGCMNSQEFRVFFFPGEMLSRASNADKTGTVAGGILGKEKGFVVIPTTRFFARHTKLGGNE